MRPAIYTIPSDVPFLDALVAGLLARGGGKPLALPRMAPVGDVDAEELVLLGEDVDGAAGLDIPPPVPELRRQLLLTRLVLGWGRARGSGPLTAGQAVPLARELARFLD